MKPVRSSAPRSWEIFCRVVDNLGDIGVCWRLARTLARAHGLSVRLWVDDWGPFARLCPTAAGAAAPFFAEGVEVRRWPASWSPVEPADVVVEAFACEVPEAHLEAMARRPVAPAWINLEYLSAEEWIEGCHGLSSPHPRLPLVKHFFFPGFTAATGGLLREAGLVDARDAFQNDPAERAARLQSLGVAPPPAGTAIASLFAYALPAGEAMVAAWAAGPRPLLLLVPEGRMVGELAAALGVPRPGVGERLARGALAVAVVPFTDQDAYDRLLWSCDLNFVRGEDSFVRAQWAARPLVWQIYRQAEDAHGVKLDAFLARYGEGLDSAAAAALAAFWRAWNGNGDPAAAWGPFAAALPRLGGHARAWSGRLAALPDLATKLVHFCAQQVKS